MGYQRKALEGFSWQTALRIITSLISLIKISIIARILSPNDFGLFSLTAIALGLGEAVTQTGINITLLQSTKPMLYFLDTAWVIAIIRGIIISIVMIIVGLLMGKYFQNPLLFKLVIFTAIIPFIKGFINPSVILFIKELEYLKETIFRASLVGVDAIIAIIFSLYLRSVEALVIGLVGSAIIEVFFSFKIFKLKPKLKFYQSRAKTIFENAKWMSVSTILGYLNDNLDDLILGKITNTYQLGLYHNAYVLSHKANYELAQSIHGGILSIYTKLLDTKKRLLKAFNKTFFWGTVLIIITSLPLLIFPKQIILIIFGPAWLESTNLISWLVLAGILHGMALMAYTLFLATSNYKSLNFHQFINLALTVWLMIYFGNNYGLIGSVIGLTIGRIIAFPIIIYEIIKYNKSI